MKSFRKYSKDINDRDRLLMDIFEIDENETEIMFSDKFKDNLTEIFHRAVQVRIESEYDILDDDVPEQKSLKDNYIQDLAALI